LSLFELTACSVEGFSAVDKLAEPLRGMVSCRANTANHRKNKKIFRLSRFFIVSSRAEKKRMPVVKCLCFEGFYYICTRFAHFVFAKKLGQK